jgi:hypothetical protein
VDDPASIVLDLVGAGPTIRVLLNLSPEPLQLPPGDCLLASSPLIDGALVPQAAAWVELGA